MTKRRDLLGRLAAGLDIPREALPGGFLLTLSGQEELVVHGCRRILRYGQEEMALLLPKKCLCISWGSICAISGGTQRCLCFAAITGNRIRER
jgi:hypothetical protein